MVTAMGGLKNVVELLVAYKIAGWAWGASRAFLTMAAGLDAVAGTAIFATLGAAALFGTAAAIGTATVANVLARIRYGDTLNNAREQHEHPERNHYVPGSAEQAGPWSARDPLHRFTVEDTLSPDARAARARDRAEIDAAIVASRDAQKGIDAEEAERERQRHQPAFDAGPVYPPGLPGGFVPFPSPFPDRTAGGLGTGQGAVDGRLRIILEIPNLPEGATVKTETSGNVPEPQVDVGRSNPLDGF
jgi:hypothetical protein